MKYFHTHAFALAVLLLSACHTAPKPAPGVPDPAQARYATPQQAVDALADAARTGDSAALGKVLGPRYAALQTGDAAEDARALQRFSAELARRGALVELPDGMMALQVGAEEAFFPVPLLHGADGWFFDTEVGIAEMRLRRVGANELFTIAVMRALAEAQMAYAGADRDGDGVHEYAQRLSSTPGTSDGLAWTPDEASVDPMGPVGPAIASAWIDEHGSAARPYHGYFYRLLTQQGTGAAGGARSHLVDGNLTSGFAFVAFPAVYPQTGVMTFMVGHDGVVYEFDLGPATAQMARSIVEYDPTGWRRTE